MVSVARMRSSLRALPNRPHPTLGPRRADQPTQRRHPPAPATTAGNNTATEPGATPPATGTPTDPTEPKSDASTRTTTTQRRDLRARPGPGAYFSRVQLADRGVPPAAAARHPSADGLDVQLPELPVQLLLCWPVAVWWWHRSALPASRPLAEDTWPLAPVVRSSGRSCCSFAGCACRSMTTRSRRETSCAAAGCSTGSHGSLLDRDGEAPSDR